MEKESNQVGQVSNINSSIAIDVALLGTGRFRAAKEQEVNEVSEVGYIHGVAVVPVNIPPVAIAAGGTPLNIEVAFLELRLKGVGGLV